MNGSDKPLAKTRVSGTVPDGQCAAVLVYTTFPGLEAAERLGRYLVEQQLAGCINILPGMVSLYKWEGVLERSEEVVLIAKTQPDAAQACMEAVLAAHPYETPAVLAIPVVAGGADYLDWIRAQSTAGAAGGSGGA